MGESERRKTQSDKILAYLKKHKGITNYDAINEFGILQLSARIFDLRKKGYNITNVYREGIDRDGMTVRYVEYRLANGGR